MRTQIRRRTVDDIAAFLRLRPGIAKVKPLDLKETSKLLEPWLGNVEALSALPLPRLIAIEIDQTAPPDLDRLQRTLVEQFPNAAIDDHRQWRRQIQTVTRSLALAGLAILALVCLATIAIIVSATASAMATNRDIVEVLNFVGANDRFIAREFEKHFLALGIRAGVVGALVAVAIFWLMPSVIGLIGGDAVTASELGRLVGTGSLDLYGYLWLGGVVVFIALLCMVTSRFGVYRILHNQT